MLLTNIGNGDMNNLLLQGHNNIKLAYAITTLFSICQKFWTQLSNFETIRYTVNYTEVDHL